MKTASAIFVTLLMIAMPFMALPTGASQPGITTITTFGNGASDATVSVSKPLGGTDSSTEIVLPNDALVTSATFTVNGQPHTPKGTDYPHNVSVDVGADSTVDWAWDSTHNGPLGHQDTFTDGSTDLSFNFKAAANNASHSVRLPSDIKVDKATFNVSGGNLQYFNEKKYFGHPWDYMGFSTSGCGDLNGDGIPDFAAAGPHTGWGMRNYGWVDIFFGGTKLPDKPSLELKAETNDEAFGWSLACNTDLNKDGYNDVIVGAPDWNNGSLWNVGSVYIYFGGPSMSTTPSVILRGYADSDKFGTSVDGLPDMNGDGYGEVIVGAPYNASTTSGYERGAVYIYSGGKTMSTVPAQVYYGAGDYYDLGIFVASIGDVNGDKHGDYMMGAPGDGNGAVYIFYGGNSIRPLQDVTIKPTDGSSFGEWGAGGGDINGDGKADIAIQNQFDEVWVFYGSVIWNQNGDIRLTGEGVWDYFGIAISMVHDLNGDGYDDLLIGASQYNNTKATVGRVYLYFGGDPMDERPDYKWTGNNLGDEYGAGVAYIGDVSNSGAPAILLGEDGNDSYAINAGTIHVLMFANGIRAPRVDLGDGPKTIWNWTNYFHGSRSTGDISSKVALALNYTAPSYTDRYGTNFTNMTFLVNASSKGDLQITNLSIDYELTANLSDLSKVLNGYMMTHQLKGDGKFHIPIKITTNSPGNVKLSRLKITYGHLPVGTAPGGLSLAQGSSNFHFLNLTPLFFDPDDASSNLTFAVVSNTNASYLWAGIKDGHFLALDAMNHSKDVNWSGFSQVNVTAKDHQNHVSRPLGLIIDVYHVQHAPAFVSRPVLDTMEGSAYQYQAKAVDSDPGDTVNYSLAVAPKTMTIEKATGLIKWFPAASDVGNRTVVVVASDGKLSSNQTFVIKVEFKQTPGNHLPYVVSIPPTQAVVGVKYVYKISAFDDDYDILHYKLDTGPQNMTVNSTSGTVQWQPNMADLGLQHARVNISDGKDRIFHEWNIDVINVGMNHLPLINGTPPAKGYVGLELLFGFKTYDADGDPVLFWLDSGPRGMTISSAGSLSWTPTDSDVGTHTYIIEASDGKGSSYKTFSIDVSIDHMPTVSSYPGLSATVGSQYKYVMSVSDLDQGDFVTVQLVSGPQGMKLTNSTRTLLWKPTSDQKGSQSVIILISDGKLSKYQNFTVTVKGPTQSLWEQAGAYMILAILVAVICTILGVWAYMRYKKKKAEAETVIEDVFLIYRDGRLISHNTRRLKPEQDEHTMTAMLTAIQSFVEDSISTEGEGQKAIDEISFGEDKILMSHGKLVYIAAVIKGIESEGLKARMGDSVQKIESDYAEILKEWDGDLKEMEGARHVMKGLLTGAKQAPAEDSGPREYPDEEPEAKEEASKEEKEDASEDKKEDKEDASEEEKEDAPEPAPKDDNPKK